MFSESKRKKNKPDNGKSALGNKYNESTVNTHIILC